MERSPKGCRAQRPVFLVTQTWIPDSTLSPPTPGIFDSVLHLISQFFRSVLSTTFPEGSSTLSRVLAHSPD